MRNFKEEYDAVIVGSGAAGGIAAWVLVNSGLKVAMLEAGLLRNRQTDFSYAVDFKGYAADGHGKDWPISYQYIEPYYDKVERFVGVCGDRDGHPDLPDNKFPLPAVAPKCADIKLTEACAKIGIKAISVRRAVLTKAYNGYKECYYCARCESGCHTDSFFNSAFRCVTPLLKKFPRRFTLISNAMARNVTVNAKGLASGVSFVSGVALALWRRLREDAPLDRTLAVWAMLFGVLTISCFWLMQRIPFSHRICL